MPKRIQMSRQHPWRADNPDAVIVARPSRWGNPFDVKTYGLDLALALYKQALSGNWSPSLLDQSKPDAYWDSTYRLTQAFRERLGSSAPIEIAKWYFNSKDIACWCPPDQPCHADVLLELANGVVPVSEGANQ